MPDPDPGKSSGSMRIWIRIQPTLIKYISKKHPLNSIKKNNLNNYWPFSIQYCCPIVQTDQNLQFYLHALSLFAGSGFGSINPDLDPGKSSGSMWIRIRIHITDCRYNNLIMCYICTVLCSPIFIVSLQTMVIG